MSDMIEILDADFAAQMQGLASEAERALGDRSHGAPHEEGPSRFAKAAKPSEGHAITIDEASATPPAAGTSAAPVSLGLPEMLRPVLQGLQAVGRTSGEHTQILGRMEKAQSETAEAHRELPRVVGELKGLLEQRNLVSRQMFDALHEELKSYKDGFLLDTVHRPMIRDLITLYDDLSLIFQQIREPILLVAEEMEGHPIRTKLGERLESTGLHMEHNLEFILEVLARLEVSQMAVGKGKLDKRTQRAVSVEAAEDPDDDLTVVRTLKRGFFWKDRVVRAEEVVIRKWKEGFLMALKSPEE